MTSVFVVATTKAMSQLHRSKFFSTRKKAQECLRKIANERRHKLGVDVLEDNENTFSFTLGWEEAYTCFTITEIPLDTE